MEFRQIKLKAKYLRGHRGRFHGGEKPAPRKSRRKISDIEKRRLPAQPAVVLHILANGKGRFERL